MERWGGGEGEVGRRRGGEVGRWGGGEVKRWGGGEVKRRELTVSDTEMT